VTHSTASLLLGFVLIIDDDADDAADLVDVFTM
jgi:hypothetical protein